jgi:two-component system sensor histidine kinase TctE
MKPVVLSLRSRLLLAIIAPLCVVFAVSAIFDYRLARETADSAFDHSLADVALDLASHIRTTEERLSVALSAEAEEILRSDASDIVYFAVRDKAGRLLAGDEALPSHGAFAVTRMDNQMAFADRELHGKPIRIAIHQTPSAHGPVTIMVAETVNKREHSSRRILVAMVLPSLAVILATLLAVYFGVRRGLAPLEIVESEIASRSPRDLHAIDDTLTPQEIRPLLSRLNDLFALLREAAASQQRFLADAAHQLRTPLTGLQTQIDLSTNEGRFSSDPERLLRINEATERIGHLIGQLLTYARAESTAYLSQSFEPVALNDLVEQAASIFLDEALAKKIDLGFEAGQATVSGIPWMLREALANLIDNALCYTPSGGTVTVSSCRSNGECALTVEDNGPGIPAAERDRVFERFYRVQGVTGDGCGLGLAIVKEIAGLHDAVIRLEEPPGGGLRFSLVFRSAVV